MAIRRWIASGPIVLAAGLIAALLVGPGHGDPPSAGIAAPPAPANNVSAAGVADPRLVGTPSCSARGCHGRDEPAVGGRLPRDEYTTWVHADKHAAAYRALYGDRAQRIAQNLPSPRPAHEDPRCLACHALPGAATNKDLAWMQADGVGCEACHGPARDWLAPHTDPTAWGRRTLAEKASLGMTPLDDRAALCRTCAGCHVGAPPDAVHGIPDARDVNHDILAAGHPRLTFEFATFLANVPPHWSRAAHPAPGVPDWAMGQVASARAALELLAYRADSAADSPWPEFAEYDCYGCHHGLKQTSWRQARAALGRRPGRWSWDSWYFSVLMVVPQGTQADIGLLRDIRELMQGPDPGSRGVGEAARTAADALTKWEQRLRTGLDAAALRKLRADLADKGRSPDPAGWDLAEQLVLAVAAGEPSRAAGPDGKELLKQLAFPPGMESPAAFRWDDNFHESLQQFLKP